MHKKIFSSIFLALLFIGGCIPARNQNLETATAVPPSPAATQTSTPVPTATLAPATATPAATLQDIPLVDPAQASLELEAQSAVLMDAQTGDVLYDKNAHQKMYPASTTKIMTALLALEYFEPDEIVMVGEEVNLTWLSERIDAQKAGLNYRQELTMKELLYGLMLASGSDAAFTIAANVAWRASGDYYMSDEQAVAYFAGLMNEHCTAIGAVETNFTNPDGIQDPNHYSTAYDLALIARFAMQDPQFREIVSTTIYHTAEFVTSSGGRYSRSWENTNRLIQPQDPRYYAAANGIKTGTTPEAGHCLVSSAAFGSKQVIAVVLDSTDTGVWSDSVALLDAAQDNLP